MGRYDFRPQRIYSQTSQFLAARRLNRRPAWYEVVHDNPPPSILTRSRPLEHSERPQRKSKKASKRMFTPRQIEYTEDRLRARFFKDHPWELARPRIVLEEDGVNGMETWDTIRPLGRQMSGESVVQRQMFLMDNHDMTETQAYDQARSEFYAERLKEDVERRVAKEEAMHFGAEFGKDRLTISMELEDKAFEGWRTWADEEVTKREQLRMAGTVDQDSASVGTEDETTLLDDDVDLVREEAEGVSETASKQPDPTSASGRPTARRP